ncbi:MAG: acyl-CoA dehydrogenase family protein [Mycobacteriales bacterium]
MIQEDASAAGALAAEIAAREVTPQVAAWDQEGVPDDIARAFRDAGLLDPELAETVQVEVAGALGRAGLAAALAILDLDVASTTPDVRVAAAFCGAADALLDVGINYARQRHVFGRPLAKFQVQRHAFAGVAADAAAAWALTRRLAAQPSDARDPVELAAVVPVAAAVAWQAAETALQVHGGYGYSDEYPVSRMWRDVVRFRALVPLSAYDEQLDAAAGR